MESGSKASGPPDGMGGNDGGGFWNYHMLKTVGAPVALSFAMYFAYKRFFHMPNPARVPFSNRKHLVKSKTLKLSFL